MANEGAAGSRPTKNIVARRQAKGKSKKSTISAGEILARAKSLHELSTKDYVKSLEAYGTGLMRVAKIQKILDGMKHDKTLYDPSNTQAKDDVYRDLKGAKNAIFFLEGIASISLSLLTIDDIVDNVEKDSILPEILDEIQRELKCKIKQEPNTRPTTDLSNDDKQPATLESQQTIQARFHSAADAKEIGKMLTQAREMKGLTKVAVAEQMDTSEGVIRSIELGKNSPKISTIERYAKVVGLKAEIHLYIEKE